MSKAIQQLTAFGAVKTCKVIDEKIVTIVVTNEPNQKHLDTLGLMNKATKLFPEYPTLETAIAETHLFILVLKR